MARFFREPDRRQRYLLPVDMLDWLPEDDIVHLLVDAVALMDLSAFEAAYKVGKAGQARRHSRRGFCWPCCSMPTATASARAGRSNGAAAAMPGSGSSSAPRFPTTP